MIYIERFVPVDNEILLLRREDWTASEGRINIKSSGFSISWGVDDNVSDVVKGSPIAPKVINVDLVVY